MKNNYLRSEHPDLSKIKCPVIDNDSIIKESYSEYLKDESRLQGNIPEKIFFPRTSLEVAVAVKKANINKKKISISGSRTGIVGGAVPFEAEYLLSLENLLSKPEIFYNTEKKCWAIKVSSGTKLEDLQKYFRKREYKTHKDMPDNLFFPVDPTEVTASIGGMVAANASGSRTLYYGPTRAWVLGLTVILSDGSIMKLNRDEKYLDNNSFSIDLNNKNVEVKIPEINIPKTKHVAGYYLKDNMDLIDLFIGGEGTLGIITEVELKLEYLSKHCLYLSIFFKNNNFKKFISLIKKSKGIKPIAIEFLDKRSVELLKVYKQEQGEASGVPNFPEGINGVIYIEIGFEKEIEFEEMYKELSLIFKKMDISVESTWAGFNKNDLDSMKKFRHALPERINMLISQRKKDFPEITKIGTDMAVPDDSLGKIMDYYINSLDLIGLKYYIFGHIGNGHLHVNIIPDNMDDLKKAKTIYKDFAKKVVSLNGSVAAEHGIGRLKKDFLKIQFNDQEISAMKEIKDKMDPYGIFNPGVLW